MSKKRKIPERQPGDPNLIRVTLPAGKITGRSMGVVLRSLLSGIKVEHLDREIERFRIDAQDRAVIIKFKEC